MEKITEIRSRDINKKRIYINIIKGIAIFLMIWGHCIQYCVAGTAIDFFELPLFKIIYSFHMPLFMLISGYLFFYSFDKRNLRELIMHREKPLLHTIFVCTIVIYFITTCFFDLVNGKINTVFNGGWINYFSDLWFLWSVISASLGVAIICKKVKQTWLQVILLILFSFVVAMFPNATYNLYIYPYFIIGFYYAKYEKSISHKVKLLRYISLFIFPIMCLYYTKEHYIYTTGLFGNEFTINQYISIDLFRWGIGLMGSIFVLTVVKIIFDIITKNNNKNIILTGFAHAGEKSLQLYVLSTAFVSRYLYFFFPKIIANLNNVNIFTKNMFIYNYIFTLSLAVMYTIILYFLIKFLEKKNYSKILFRKIKIIF